MENKFSHRLYSIITFAFISLLANAQGYWQVKSTTDDYTMEKSSILVHYLNGSTDAVYFPEDEMLKIIRDYDGSAYFDDCWNAYVENDGKIDDYVGTVFCRIIRSSVDYDES